MVINRLLISNFFGTWDLDAFTLSKFINLRFIVIFDFGVSTRGILFSSFRTCDRVFLIRILFVLFLSIRIFRTIYAVLIRQHEDNIFQMAFFWLSLKIFFYFLKIVEFDKFAPDSFLNFPRVEFFQNLIFQIISAVYERLNS